MTLNRFEKRKKAIQQTMREHVDTFQGIYKKADSEDREPTDDERLEIEAHVSAVRTLEEEMEAVDANIKTLEHVDDVGRALGPAISVGSEPLDRFADYANRTVFPQAQKTIGEAFIESGGYKDIIRSYREQGRFPSGFSTGPVALETKGTLGEAPGSGGGALAITVPQVIPGVVEKLFQPLTFASLLMETQVSTASVRYVIEGTATSAAAGVAEAGTKPESTVGLTTADEPIKKIATLLPVSDEMLEDAPAIQSYINGRLVLFVRIEEERQLFRGTQGGNEVQGIFTSRSVPVYAGGTAAGNYAEQLFKAMNGVRGSAFVEPEWLIIHPTDWQVLRLLKDTAGQFFGGGPFQGPYGNGQNLQAAGQVQGVQDYVWQKPVWVTASIGGAGTALVGNSSSAAVYRRGGVSVEATNSHASYFQLNLVAIRAEERLGLAVYRPGAFCEVRLS